MASGGSDNGLSEETFDYICTSCAEENVIKEGIRYCVECKGYCCKVCVSNHKKYPALRQHGLLDISTSQHGDQTLKLPSFPTEKCSFHQGKVIDVFCGDHDVVGCCTCIVIDHRNCTDIHSIPDDVDQITKDGEFDNTYRDLQTMTESLKSTQQNSNNIYIQNLERAKQNALLAITEHRRETEAILDRLEDDAKNEVQLLYDQMKANLLNAKEKIESSLNIFLELGEKIRRTQGNKSQMFVCSKLVSSTITKEQDDIKTSKEELETFTGDNVFSFVAEKSLTFLQQTEYFGQVKVKTLKKNTPYGIKQCQSIVARIPSDTSTCKLRGCCLLGDNELIIADCANKKLKRVDIVNVSVVDHIDIPHAIRGVCRVKNNEVAVGCYNENMIQFVSVGATMTLSRQMKLNHTCYHVAYMDKKLYVSDDGGPSVYIYDMIGTLLQTITKDSSGSNLFTFTMQIALCDSEDYMFVGGYDGLVCFDKKGNHIATIKDPDIDGANGVCIDGRGNVFVAGRNSDNVVQFRYDGTKMGVIVKKKDGIREPMALFFHRKLRKLFVYMIKNNNIKMFDLE